MHVPRLAIMVLDIEFPTSLIMGLSAGVRMVQSAHLCFLATENGRA